MSEDRNTRANGVDLCVESFGDPAHPAILLIHGAAASMLSWEDAFCKRLAAGSRFALRYDHRDTGRSESYPPSAPPYSMADLMEDAVGLLDVFELDRDHLVGRSMGGGLALLAAFHHPERVRSLTLMVTSPGGRDLSPPSAEFLSFLQGGQQPDWSDREAVIDRIVAMLRIFDGGTPHFDDRVWHELIARDVDRTVNVASSQINHFRLDPGEPIRPRLGEIKAPTLVIHGARDPIFPVDHGRALAAEIPSAELLVLPGSGHLVLPRSWDLVTPAILRYTAEG